VLLEVVAKLSDILTEHQNLELRLLVTRPTQTGVILGRSSATIERLRRDFCGVEITLRPFASALRFSSSHPAPLFDPSRTVEVLEIIGPDHSEVLGALRPVADLLALAFKKDPQPRSGAPASASVSDTDEASWRAPAPQSKTGIPPVVFTIMVPKNQAGQLIGRGGRVSASRRI
jgi:hypothetical protein